MKIEHWKIVGRDVKTRGHEIVDVHSTGISGDRFELTGQVKYSLDTPSTLDTYVTISLTREEVEQFVDAISKTLGLKQ